MRIKDFIKILISLLLITFIVLYLYKKSYFSIIYKCNLSDIGVLILLTFSGYLLAGYQLYYLMKVQNNISLTKADTVLLPFSMSLFAYVIPTNGGLLYSVFFLKKKYNVDSSKGFSIGVFSIYISFILTGIIGLIVCIIFNKIVSYFSFISILLTVSPFIIILFNRLVQKVKFKNESYLQKIQIYIDHIIVSSKDLIINKNIETTRFFIAHFVVFISKLRIMLIVYIYISVCY